MPMLDQSGWQTSIREYDVAELHDCEDRWIGGKQETDTASKTPWMRLDTSSSERTANKHRRILR